MEQSLWGSSRLIMTTTTWATIFNSSLSNIWGRVWLGPWQLFGAYDRLKARHGSHSKQDTVLSMVGWCNTTHSIECTLSQGICCNRVTYATVPGLYWQLSVGFPLFLGCACIHHLCQFSRVYKTTVTVTKYQDNKHSQVKYKYPQNVLKYQNEFVIIITVLYNYMHVIEHK